jgi:short-subunit dehydrogenase
MKLNGCTALVTGASAGIGRELAVQLARRGAKVLVLVARRLDRLEQLTRELTAENPQLTVHTRAADLSTPDEVSGLADWLQQKGITIDLLVNNAGVGDRGAFATSEQARISNMLEVNVVALTSLTHRLLPPMLAARHGAILNVSSCASFMPMPGLAVYAATKAYVTSFTEALRMEVREKGLAVAALCPGPVHTEFDTVARRADEPGRPAPEFSYVSATEVVRAGLDGIEQEKPLVIPGLAMKVAAMMLRATPMPNLSAVARVPR